MMPSRSREAILSYLSICVIFFMYEKMREVHKNSLAHQFCRCFETLPDLHRNMPTRTRHKHLQDESEKAVSTIVRHYQFFPLKRLQSEKQFIKARY